MNSCGQIIDVVESSHSIAFRALALLLLGAWSSIVKIQRVVKIFYHFFQYYSGDYNTVRNNQDISFLNSISISDFDHSGRARHPPQLICQYYKLSASMRQVLVYLVVQVENITSLACRISQKLLVALVYTLLAVFSYLYMHYLYGAQPAPGGSMMWARLGYTAAGLLLLYNLVYNYSMAGRLGPGSPLDIRPTALGQHRIDKRCQKCAGRKPVRTHHCSICNQCVLQMDHHCPWLGTCIGHLNRRYFLNFLTYLTLGCLLFVCMIVSLGLPRADVYLFMLVVAAVIGVFCLFHWVIALCGRTTLQVCAINDGYRPSSEAMVNFEIVFGTRNVVKALLPMDDGLSYWGCEWNQKNRPRVEFQQNQTMLA